MLDLCLLRKGPQDLPDSFLLLVLLFGFDLFISGLAAATHSDFPASLLETSISALLLGGYVTILLWVSRHPERMVRTCAAAFGADALMTLVALPILLLGALDGGLWVSVLLLASLVYSLVIFGNILKVALGIGWALGLALSLVFNILSMSLLDTFFQHS